MAQPQLKKYPSLVGTFCLRQPTLVVNTVTRRTVMLPTASIVEVLTEPPAENRLMDVVVNGATAAKMFVVDLRSRGVRDAELVGVPRSPCCESLSLVRCKAV